MAKATETKSAHEVMAEQLGDAGLWCLAQINVAASTAIANIERIDDIDLVESDDYEYFSKIPAFTTTLKRQCLAIVNAYKTFSETTERFAMMLSLSEILARVDPSISNAEKLYAVAKKYCDNDEAGEDDRYVLSWSEEVLGFTRSMGVAKRGLPKQFASDMIANAGL